MEAGGEGDGKIGNWNGAYDCDHDAHLHNKSFIPPGELPRINM